MRRATRSGLCLAAALAVLSAACSRTPITEASAPAASTSSHAPVGTLDLAYDKPAVVGTVAQATASGLPAGKTVDLTWGTVTGGWVVEDYYHFRGKKYAEPPFRRLFAVDGDGSALKVLEKPREDANGLQAKTSMRNLNMNYGAPIERSACT